MNACGRPIVEEEEVEEGGKRGEEDKWGRRRGKIK